MAALQGTKKPRLVRTGLFGGRLRVRLSGGYGASP